MHIALFIDIHKNKPILEGFFPLSLFSFIPFFGTSCNSFSTKDGMAKCTVIRGGFWIVQYNKSIH